MEGKKKSVTEYAIWFVLTVIVGGGLLTLFIDRVWERHDKQKEQNLPLRPLPPRDTDTGTTQFPYKNPSTQGRLVHSAILEILASPPDLPGAGAALPKHEIRFEQRHFNKERNRYERHVDDLVIDPGEIGVIEIKLLMPGPRKYVYARLTLFYDDNGDKPITFDPRWIKTESSGQSPRGEMEHIEPPVPPADQSKPNTGRRSGRRR
jgi:hypothetical protein